MLGLNKKEKKFFANFLIGHIALISIAFLFGLIPSCEEEEKEVHVFELATASFVSPAAINKLTPIETTKMVPVPPKPVPFVEPILSKVKKNVPTQKHNKPLPKLPPKVVELPKAEPKPKPVVQPTTVSFDQFRKKHNLKSPKAPQVIKTHTPRIHINAQDFKLPDIRISQSSPQVSSVDPTLLNRYLGEVKAKLEVAWRRLQQSSQVASGGEAYLSFKISSNGTLITPSISRTSGNAALDRLVIQVSKDVGNLGRPPGGKLSSFLEIPFRVR